MYITISDSERYHNSMLYCFLIAICMYVAESAVIFKTNEDNGLANNYCIIANHDALDHECNKHTTYHE